MKKGNTEHIGLCFHIFCLTIRNRLSQGSTAVELDSSVFWVTARRKMI